LSLQAKPIAIQAVRTSNNSTAICGPEVFRKKKNTEAEDKVLFLRERKPSCFLKEVGVFFLKRLLNFLYADKIRRSETVIILSCANLVEWNPPTFEDYMQSFCHGRIPVCQPTLFAIPVKQKVQAANQFMFAMTADVPTIVHIARQGVGYCRGRGLYRSFLRSVFRWVVDPAFFLAQHIYGQYSPGIVHHFAGGLEIKR